MDKLYGELIICIIMATVIKVMPNLQLERLYSPSFTCFKNA